MQCAACPLPSQVRIRGSDDVNGMELDVNTATPK